MFSRSLQIAQKISNLYTRYSQVCFSQTFNSSALFFEEFGEPNSVIKLQQQNVEQTLEPHQIKIQMKAAPINPSDLLTIQGKYPLKPTLPGIAGQEGVGEVVAIGSNVTKHTIGDWVVPLKSALGTYRTLGVFNADDWHKIASDIPLEYATSLTINPPTALGMLETFVDLQEGDAVIQNGATGSVGQYVIQLCKLKKLKSINIIRERPDMKETVEKLIQMGADIVSTEDKVRDDHKATGLPPPKLALNAIGGESATTMAKMLTPRGFHITYGAMGGGYLSIPPALLIFRDINFRGFWISGTVSEKLGSEGKALMLDRCVKYMQQGFLFKPNVKWFPLSEFQQAFDSSQTAHKFLKVVFKM